MRRKGMLPPPPARKELRENPVKLCCEIARLQRARVREQDNGEGVMTQPGAHLVLSVLATGDGVTQLDLVKSTHLRAPSVSVILKKMEAEGIVVRKSDEKDLRALRVFLTERGREIDREAIARVLQIDKVALHGISDGDVSALMRVLPRLRDNLLAFEEEEAGKDL